MNLRQLRCLGVVLGLTPGMLGSPALAADESPDLRLTISGQPSDTNKRDVTFTVKNESAWWADETTLRVETIAPNPGNVRVIAIENLDPGQSTFMKYSLAADCAGHTIKATIAPARN